MLQTSELQQKYAFLLQPIRDLTKNFEVDLLHVLEEYIEELEKMEFTLEDGKTINFAEAAMLIQGSVHVWGRKVEYLHGLVGQTLNMLANRKNASDKEQSGNTSNAKDGDDDDGLFEDDDIKFLSLNDEKGTNNRLPKSHNCRTKPLPTAATLALEIENSNRGTTLERKSENDNIYHIQDFVAVCATSYNDSVSMLQADTDAHGFYKIKTTPLSILRKSGPVAADFTADDSPDAATIATNPPSMEPNLPPIVEEDNFDVSMNDGSVHHEEEHTVHIQGMELRRAKPNITVKSDETQEIELLDEHTISNEFNSKPFFKNRSAKSMKKQKPVLFMKFLFDLDKKNSKYKSSLDQCLSLLVENNSHEHEIAILRKQIKKEIKTEKNAANIISEPEEEDLIAANEPNMEDMFDDNDIEADCFDDDDFANPLGIAQEKEEGDDQIPMSYEDLVQQNVQKFYQEALRFKQDNELAKRVKQWEERVVPLLKEQNSRPEFDIHECGDRMVSKFANNGDIQLFQDCVKDCRYDWEICRLFAATLQLVNDGNFFISKNEDVNSMKLELLSKKRSRERLDNYDGPPLQM